MRKKGSLYSLIDIAMMVTGKGYKYAAQQIDRVKERYHEVSAKCRNLKFPSRGQRETPAGDLYTVNMLLPGRHAAQVRRPVNTHQARDLDLSKDHLGPEMDPKRVLVDFSQNSC